MITARTLDHREGQRKKITNYGGDGGDNGSDCGGNGSDSGGDGYCFVMMVVVLVMQC